MPTQRTTVDGHSSTKQTFEFEKSISTAGKSILNFRNCQVWLQNILKCGKYNPVKFANFVYFCITHGKAVPTMWKCAW